jgi:hypothetical protein
MDRTIFIASAIVAGLLIWGCGDSRCVSLPSGTGPTQHISNSPSVRFAVIGDYGLAGGGEKMVSGLVKSLSPDLVITTGDNNYPNGSGLTIDINIGQYYSDFIHPYSGAFGKGASMNRFFPSLGNHDWPPRAYLKYFTLPGNERYYDFTWGPVHFFAVDTFECEPDGIDSGSIQADWLRDGLASSTKPFRFVYGHHPPYSSSSRTYAYMRWPFGAWGADAFFAGHDHFYERLDIGGVLYFIAGLGGRDMHGFGTPAPGSVVRYNDEFGAMLVEVIGNTATFSFFDVSNNLIDNTVVAK